MRLDTKVRAGLWAGTGAEEIQSSVTVGSGNNSQSAAVAVTGDVVVVTTSSATANTGVRLPAAAGAGDTIYVANQGANSVVIYPATGGKINGGSANAGLTLASTKNVVLKAVSASDWIAVVTA